MFDGPFAESIVSRAVKQNKVEVAIHDLKQWGEGKRRTVDDHPYGGGIGMILMAEPIYKALSALGVVGKVRKLLSLGKTRTILLSPRGTTLTQDVAKRLSTYNRLVLICGHYEGVDERINDYVDEELSLGDFVLTGGEIAAMAVTDAVVRLIPGVLKEGVTDNESFSGKSKMLEYPQYTRPENFKGKKVPPILLSGNHGEIRKWRDEQSKKLTKMRRPDITHKTVSDTF